MSTHAPSRTDSQGSHERAFRAFVRASALLRLVMEPYFAGHGISGAQWGVLRTLYRAEVEGAPRLVLKELGRRMLVRPPSMTGVVDRLQRSGHVRKRSSPTDKRAKEVSLTLQGRTLVQNILVRHPAQIRDVLGVLNEKDARTFLRLVTLLSTRLESLSDDARTTR